MTVAKARGVTSSLARLAYLRGCVLPTDGCEDGIKRMSKVGGFDSHDG